MAAERADVIPSRWGKLLTEGRSKLVRELKKPEMVPKLVARRENPLASSVRRVTAVQDPRITHILARVAGCVKVMGIT